MHKSTMDTSVLNELMGGWSSYPGLEIVHAGPLSVCPIVLHFESPESWGSRRGAGTQIGTIVPIQMVPRGMQQLNVIIICSV